jgi:uncharacterized protein
VSEAVATVPTEAGELRAVIWRPEDSDRPDARPQPGVVLVDGSGDGTADETWRGLAAVVTGCGAVALSHDKPGCGGSPGDWRDQSLHDRARETLAAVEKLRRQPDVDSDRVGLLGVSQGGWVSCIAASMAPDALEHVVTISGMGVSPVEQERFRLEVATGGDAEAMAFVDERMRRIIGGEGADSILALQAVYADRPWHEAACEYIYEDAALFPFLARIATFDPATVLPHISCRVFAAFGGADESVPVPRCVEIISSLLPASPEHAIVVYPNADHGLGLDTDPDLSRADRLAPGFMPMLAAWLHR